ncbi:unnamed protein product, partial [Amoebophrya sp. A25]
DGFKKYVIPIIFNLLKRGESWNKFQSVADETISEYITSCRAADRSAATNVGSDGEDEMEVDDEDESAVSCNAGVAEAIAHLFTPKALFHFVFLQSETPLKLRLLLDFNTLHALPLIHPGHRLNA